eukprot:scaffold98518_cov21-Tisochrysis_lutea.AAC.1
MIPTCSREMGNLTVPCAPQPVQCISYKHLQHTRPACARMHVCRLITDTSRKAYSDSTSSTNSSSRSNSSRTIAATHLLPSAPSVTSTSCLCLPNVTAVQQLIVLLSANHTSAHEPEATHLKTTFPGVDCLSAPHPGPASCGTPLPHPPGAAPWQTPDPALRAHPPCPAHALGQKQTMFGLCSACMLARIQHTEPGQG